MRQVMSFVFAALAVSSANAADLPKYWNVHIDTVADRATYDDMHKQEYAIQRDVLAAHNVPRGPQWKFSTSDGVYFSLRGRASLAEFEKPSSTPADVLKEIQNKEAPLEPKIHGSLREHHSEVWQTDNDVTFLPSVAATKFIRYRVDTIKPSKSDECGEVQKAIRAAAEKKGISVVAFYGAYGDGRYHYLFLSHDAINLASLVGADVMQRWKDCIVTSNEADAKERTDLTLTDPAKWIQ